LNTSSYLSFEFSLFNSEIFRTPFGMLSESILCDIPGLITLALVISLVMLTALAVSTLCGAVISLTISTPI